MKELSNKPISIDRHTWYYEEKKGMCIVREVKDKKGNLIQTEMFYIPWKEIIASVSKIIEL